MELKVCMHDPENKIQLNRWLPRRSKRPHNFSAAGSAKEVMAAGFWNSEDIIKIGFFHGKGTVTGPYCGRVLQNLEKFS